MIKTIKDMFEELLQAKGLDGVDCKDWNWTGINITGIDLSGAKNIDDSIHDAVDLEELEEHDAEEYAPTDEIIKTLQKNKEELKKAQQKYLDKAIKGHMIEDDDEEDEENIVHHKETLLDDDEDLVDFDDEEDEDELDEDDLVEVDEEEMDEEDEEEVDEVINTLQKNKERLDASVSKYNKVMKNRDLDDLDIEEEKEEEYDEEDEDEEEEFHETSESFKNRMQKRMMERRDALRALIEKRKVARKLNESELKDLSEDDEEEKKEKEELKPEEVKSLVTQAFKQLCKMPKKESGGAVQAVDPAVKGIMMLAGMCDGKEHELLHSPEGSVIFLADKDGDSKVKVIVDGKEPHISSEFNILEIIKKNLNQEGDKEKGLKEIQKVWNEIITACAE